MRVSFVTLETVHHRETPATERLHRVATGLADRGHDVTVHCARWWEGPTDTFSPDAEGVDPGADGTDGITYRGVVVEPGARSAYLLRLPFSLARARPDVVHASGADSRVARVASLGASFARAPLLLDWHGEDAPEPVDRWGRGALNAADHVVTPSRLVRTRIREAGGDGEKVDVVPNAISMDLIRETDPGDAGEVVYARRLDEGANLESMLLGLAEFRERDWSATVIGDGPRREEYEQQASDLRIADRLTFAGECSLEERVAAYKSAHVFVQTAKQCAFADELLRALACGCVGIVEYHAESSAHELVEGRDRGFRTTDEAELADAIGAASDLDHRTVDEAFAEFDERAVLEQYLDVYRTLTEEHGLL